MLPTLGTFPTCLCNKENAQQLVVDLMEVSSAQEFQKETGDQYQNMSDRRSHEDSASTGTTGSSSRHWGGKRKKEEYTIEPDLWGAIGFFVESEFVAGIGGFSTGDGFYLAGKGLPHLTKQLRRRSKISRIYTKYLSLLSEPRHNRKPLLILEPFTCF